MFVVGERVFCLFILCDYNVKYFGIDIFLERMWKC